MASTKDDTLRALCAEGMKLGMTPTEFWRRVKMLPGSEENLEEAAHSLLHEARSGGIPCSKCDGSGEFRFSDGRIGPCFRCKGKGFEDPSDVRRNYGHRVHHPHTHAVRSDQLF